MYERLWMRCWGRWHARRYDAARMWGYPRWWRARELRRLSVGAPIWQVWKCPACSTIERWKLTDADERMAAWECAILHDCAIDAA